MNNATANSIAAGVVPALQPTYKPADAVRILTGNSRSGNSPNHVERDISTLRRAGITPEKVAGRWIVRAGELQRFAAAPAAEPQRIDRRRREHRQLRGSKEVRHG